ncbi:aldolase/citrate lyase family protein, partial [Salmonella enterica]|uniref:aldolase/citrate lyase family protein n=1 Tax=Salmonella enterica TaxID=28901 RepID=UPI003CFA8E43
GFGRSELVIRVNAPGSPWFEADMAAAAAAGPDAVLIPKVSDAETLRAVGARLSALGAPERTKVWAMIETARSLLALDAIAACAEE